MENLEQCLNFLLRNAAASVAYLRVKVGPRRVCFHRNVNRAALFVVLDRVADHVEQDLLEYLRVQFYFLRDARTQNDVNLDLLVVNVDTERIQHVLDALPKLSLADLDLPVRAKIARQRQILTQLRLHIVLDHLATGPDHLQVEVAIFFAQVGRHGRVHQNLGEVQNGVNGSHLRRRNRLVDQFVVDDLA